MSKIEELAKIKEECLNCYKCELGKTRKNIEAPGADEDATGTPFVGRAGKFLTKLMEECGFDRNKDFYICNTIKCRPPENRVPTDEEKAQCEKYLLEQIKIINPKVIVLCGATSAKSFLGKKIKISQIRGQWFKIFDGIDATVILHPSFLLRKHSEEEGSPRWLTKEDLKKIKEFIS